MIIVTAGIIFNGDKFLIARRAPGKHMGGYWEFPGGKLEPNETPEACLRREIKEELSIDIIIDSFLADNEHYYSNKHILLKAYICTYISGVVQLKDHDEIRWIYSKQLNSYVFAPADVAFVNMLSDKDH